MINNLFLVCSIVVLYPDHTDYIALRRCKFYELSQVSQLLAKHGINPYDNDIVLSPLKAEQERILREGMDDEE